MPSTSYSDPIFKPGRLLFAIGLSSLHKLPGAVADVLFVGETLVLKLAGVRDGRPSADPSILAGDACLQHHLRGQTRTSSENVISFKSPPGSISEHACRRFCA
jgi:hypothetical protein